MHFGTETLPRTLGLAARKRVGVNCWWFRFPGGMFHDGKRIWGAEGR